MNSINKDTTLCMSLAGRPGNFGTRFHNFLYAELGLNFIYKAFTTGDLKAAIGGVRALGVRGCAVSMPFKETCIAFIDELDPSAAAIQSVNTIVNTAGRLKAYNTDYIAIAQLIQTRGLSKKLKLALRGSGGMAKAVASAFRDAGFAAGTIIARNESAGRSLAKACGYAWQKDPTGIAAELLVNVTPIGMTGGAEVNDLAFEPELVDRATAVFDVVSSPAETPLIRYARSKAKPVITGADVFVIQALEQFVLYTGIRPTAEQIQRAGAFARA